jgi:ketosteroid isomerase-like protein
MSAEIISRFYEAIQRRVAQEMGECYQAHVAFSDPVFPDLRGEAARSMWHMLCAQAKDLRVDFRSVEARGDTGHAHWEADYSFGAKKRPVHNVVEASFRFKDGKIVEHRDHFDLWKWSKMALGLPGSALGWSPPFRWALQMGTKRLLKQYMDRRT